MRPETRPDDPTEGLSPDQVSGYEALATLALDLRWSWNHVTDEVWRVLDAELWEMTHNPWVVLQTVSRNKIAGVLNDADFRGRLTEIMETRRRTLTDEAWFQKKQADASLTSIAYFSMEFMLSEALPIYSGGLGNVAGDQLKAAGDLGVPLVGVGLLYQQGYFRQVIGKDGAQKAMFPYNDPGQLPIRPVRQDNGEWLRIEVTLPGHSLWLRAWHAQVGRVMLYLLDTNDPANLPAHRAIASELYGGGPELRLQQEIVLGIVGWRLLGALGLQPEVCHLNEGHAGFAVLERAATFMKKTGHPFEVALAATRAGNLFTTHTAVPAGFDLFPASLIEQYLGRYAEENLGISSHELLALGRRNPNDSSEPFNMAYLATRGSGAVNGVSKLHESVSKRIFLPLYPRWPQEEIPVGHVTNGIHVPTWDSTASNTLWTETCGPDRWLGPSVGEQKIEAASDEQLWQLRTASRDFLIRYTRTRVSRGLAVAGAQPELVEQARHLFNPEALTLGFARRFATYKRPNLLLHDRGRLLRILSNPERPVQLFIAGKAHPEDSAGQALIQEWVTFIRQPEVRPYIAFLSDYDMNLTKHLVHGVDLWINNPRRPWEASGTSGMKVLVNGGVNLSELDGWWVEAYNPEVGWKLGDGQEHEDDPAWDAVEADELYNLLEQEVIPEFYERDNRGISTKWVARMRKSMSLLTPQFSADRTVREYTEKYYLPAAAEYGRRVADKGEVGKSIVEWRKDLDVKLSAVRFGELQVEGGGDEDLFNVDLWLNDLSPCSVLVELFANGLGGEQPERFEMKLAPKQDEPSAYVCSVSVARHRPPADYTVRIVPQHEGVAIPLEDSRIMWQR